MTRFLCNDSLWDELTFRVKSSRKVKAAVAFVGNGGADLLPLKKGDTLVVNLGLQTVKQGATSPKEIQRLIKRGVQVFTRSNLHAKFFICDDALLVGSANISNNSQKVLDEAASLTTDKAALRRAADFFDKICTEPVRPDYLKLCLKEYRAPVFGAADKGRSSPRPKRVVEAKVWFIGGLSDRDVPSAEVDRAERVKTKAARQLKRSNGTCADYVHYPSKPSYFDDIRVGDWIVTCVADSDGERDVWPPQQVLGQESYPRGQGKHRYLLNCEAEDGAEPMPLSQFRRHIRSTVPKLDTERPRTMAITNIESADSILSLWTAGGRIAAQRKAKAKQRGLGYDG
jgi:hypothetical protein